MSEFKEVERLILGKLQVEFISPTVVAISKNYEGVGLKLDEVLALYDWLGRALGKGERKRDPDEAFDGGRLG